MEAAQQAEIKTMASLIVREMESQHRTLLELLDDDCDQILTPSIIKQLKFVAIEFIDYLKLADKRTTMMVLHQELVDQLFDAQSRTLVRPDEEKEKASLFVLEKLRNGNRLGRHALTLLPLRQELIDAGINRMHFGLINLHFIEHFFASNL